MHADRHAAEDPFALGAAPSLRPTRTGSTRIEQRAIARVRTLVAAMPASLVVQLALWPDELARWARAERAAESVVYNLLARRKPYLRMRERLAASLGVQTGVLAELIDAPRADVAALLAGPAPQPDPGTAPWGGLRPRTGTNALERRAVQRVEQEIAALPAATVVGLAMWPETLTEWARVQGLHASAVWATLAGAPSDGVAAAIAHRLSVSTREVHGLIDAERVPAGSGAPGPAAHAGASAGTRPSGDPDPAADLRLADAPVPRPRWSDAGTPSEAVPASDAPPSAEHEPPASRPRPRTRPPLGPAGPCPQLSLEL